MTIGKFGYNPEDGPNPDFVCLKKCREEICKNLGLDWKEMHLSMGMSNDFEQAVIINLRKEGMECNFSFYRLKWAALMYELVLLYLGIDQRNYKMLCLFLIHLKPTWCFE